MANDAIQYFQQQRREHLRKHEDQRRATAKAEGPRRIDVTLRGKVLNDDYATVRRYIEGLSRLWIERNALSIRLSDTEIIRWR